MKKFRIDKALTLAFGTISGGVVFFQLFDGSHITISLVCSIFAYCLFWAILYGRDKE